MLSDEEKKAIDHIKNYPINWLIENVNESAIKIVLNLIEKQQKEIESLKEDNKKKSIVIIEYQDLYEKLEDKIKAKIEELNKDFKEYENGQEWEIQDEIRGQIDVLESLLEKE